MNRVPKLRFKEFIDEWEEKKLGEVSDVRDGTHDSPKYIDNGYPLVTSKNVQNGKIDLKNINYISLEDFEMINKRSKVSKGDILMGMIGTIGNLAIVDRDDFAIKNVALIKEKNVLKNSVLYQILQSNIFYKKLSLLNEGGTQKFISLGNIRNLNFNIPCLEEQQKISVFLSNIDKKISIAEEKLELFNEYKKGIMQKIFNQELRFKDENGNDYPEWEEKKLGDLITSQGGKALEKYSNENGKYKFISIGNYSENSKFFDNGRRIDLNPETQKQLLNKNELAMILNDKTKTGNIIGRTLLIEEDDMYIYNQRSQRIVCNKEFLPKFAYVLLNSSYRNNIIQNAQGGTQIYINFSTIENFIINLPCLEEQQKIADFLSAIDTKIEKISDELENLKEFKKGLLQQMFV